MSAQHRDGLERDAALEARLAQHLDGEIYAYRRVPSTMDVGHDLAAQGRPEGTLVWAQRQGRGRGRFGRTWESPEGGVYFSLIFRPTRPPEIIPQLSLVAGLAVAEAIRALTGLTPSIRWPNDLIITGRKVCGILIEQRADAVVAGFGVNGTSDPAQMPDTAISLAAAGAAVCDPYRLTGEIARRFRVWYTLWHDKGFLPIHEALRPWIGMFGHPVKISTGAGAIEGTASDLDDQGRLVVRLDSGLMQTFKAGEVTLLQSKDINSE